VISPRVCARRVDNTGLFGDRYDAPTGLILEGHGPPRLAGSHGRYLLLHGNNFSNQGFVEIMGVRLDWPHGQAAAVVAAQPFSIEAGADDVILDDLSFDTTSRSHWVVVRRDAELGNLRVMKLGFRGQLVENEFVPLLPGHDARTTAIAYDDDHDRHLLVAGLSHPTAQLRGRLQFDAMLYDPVAAPALVGTGCGAGRFRWSGSQHIGDQFTQLELLQGAPAAFTLLAAAMAPAALPLQPFGMPGCTLLVDVAGPLGLGVVGGVSDAGGRVVLPLPLPEGLPALALHWQAFQLVPGANAAGVVATRGFVVPLGL
jgi:hypothetical protein